MKRHLLIIDPQNDFCDPKGSLYVPGADQDMDRLAATILGGKLEFDGVTVTMDQHVKNHIAHAISWVDKDGAHPDPFTMISLADIRSRQWKAANPERQQWAEYYVEQLAKQGKYTLTIWPEHCLIGSWGACIFPLLYEALQEWQAKTGKDVDWVLKGQDRDTEHYSAVRAEVEREQRTNFKLLYGLGSVDELYVAGEASTHCVASTVRDMVHFVAGPGGNPKSNIDPKRLRLLVDTMSPVPIVKELEEQFFKEMTELGAVTTNTAAYRDVT